MGRAVTEVSSEIEQPGTGRDLASLGPVVAVVLGISLWVQLASFAFQEQLGPEGTPPRIIAFVLPFAALVGGIWFRNAVALLALFPMSLVPPLLLVPEGVGPGFTDPASAATICASMALYLSLVSAWLTGAEFDSHPVTDGEVEDRRAAEYRRAVYPRILPLVLWWAVPTYAIFWDGAVVGTIVGNFGDGAAIAQLFLSMLLFFGWCVVAYMYFIVPALNLEYDRRRIEREIRDVVSDDTPRAAVRRIAITAAVAILGTVILLLVV